MQMTRTTTTIAAAIPPWISGTNETVLSPFNERRNNCMITTIGCNIDHLNGEWTKRLISCFRYWRVECSTFAMPRLSCSTYLVWYQSACLRHVVWLHYAKIQNGGSSRYHSSFRLIIACASIQNRRKIHSDADTGSPCHFPVYPRSERPETSERKP